MRYSLQRIVHNLRYHLLIYAFITINFMLGAGLLIICMNYAMTSRELLEESRQKNAEGVIRVTYQALSASGNDEELRDSYSISYNEYLRLSADERYAEELALLFAISYVNYDCLSESEQHHQVFVYFTNENLFAYLYGFSPKEDTVYLGDAAYRELAETGEAIKRGGEVLFMGREMYIEGERLMIDGEAYAFESAMPSEENAVMPGTERTGYDMAAAVILPIAEIARLQEQDIKKYNLQSSLFLRYRSAERREDLVAQMLRELNDAGSRFYFSVDDEYAALQHRINDFNYDMDRWMFASISILLLSGAGCMGSMFLLLSKRRHMLAVSVACGATIRRVMLETIAEIFLVLLSGGMLGILIAPGLKKIFIYQEELRLNPAGIGLVSAAAVLFSVVSVLLGMREMKMRNVAVLLKEN